jgi:DNA-binding transcriptional LysR family regulator
MDEAKRLKGKLTGKLRIGAGSNSNHAAVGTLLGALAEKCPEVEVHLEHGTSREILAAIRNGTLDAGFYNEPGEPDPQFATAEVSQFHVHVVAPRGLVKQSESPDWKALAELAWIYPASSACCGQTAENLFKANRFRPKRIVSVDREEITRGLVAAGTGVGLLHDATAKEAEARGEVEIIAECPGAVKVLFAHSSSRSQDPVVMAAVALLTAG